MRIQRVPKGLTEILGMFGPENPSELSNSVVGMLGLEQFYARAQLQSYSSTVTSAQGTQTSFTASSWGFLVAASMEIVSTATQTAYAGSLRFTQTSAGSPLITLAHGNWNDGGLGAGREFCVCEFVPAVPFLMARGNVLVAELDALGVDPTAQFSLQVLFGALG